MNQPDRRIYLAGLIATWNERDALYLRPKRLTLGRSEIAAILAWRRREAMCLDEPERGLALEHLRKWCPS